MEERRRLLTNSGEVYVPDGYVDLGLSVLWARGNICKSSNGTYSIGYPTDYGCYFSWGNIEGHNPEENYNFTSSVYSSTPGATLTDSIASNDAAHDAALACFGDKNRMPTQDDINELIDNCTYTWTTDYRGTGVAGGIFTSNKNGNEIFLPAAGGMYETTLKNAGTIGMNLSSSISTRANSCMYLLTNTSNTRAIHMERYMGMPIRSVYPRTFTKQSNENGRFVVNGYEVVDLGPEFDFVIATYNVGATTETEYGNYYKFGTGTLTYDTNSSYYSGNPITLPLSEDTARQVMGEPWRMPIKNELYTLKNNTTFSWTTINNVSGAKLSRIVSGKERYVFFPNAGMWSTSGYESRGSGVWSSTPNGSSYAYALNLFPTNTTLNIKDKMQRSRGLSVRGVISKSDL